MPKIVSRVAALTLVLAAGAIGCGGGSGSGDPGAAGPTGLLEAAQAKQMFVGAAIAPEPLGLNGGAAVQAYIDTVKQNFNIVTFENQLKWPTVHPTAGTGASAYSFSLPDQMLEFARANGMVVRGHNLLWYTQTPKWLPTYSGDWSALLQDHITTVMTHYKGKIRDWDVVNEIIADDGSLRGQNTPVTGSGLVDWYAKVGPKFYVNAFTWARAADPGARLFINDYSVERPGAKADRLYALAQELKGLGLLDGVGFQFHLGAPEPDYAAIEGNLQRFIALGLEVQVTEADYRLPTPVTADALAQQARFFSRILSMLKNNGQHTFVAWGVDDSHSWLNQNNPGCQPLLFDAKYQPKPAVEAMVSALNQ